MVARGNAPRHAADMTTADPAARWHRDGVSGHMAGACAILGLCAQVASMPPETPYRQGKRRSVGRSSADAAHPKDD